MNHLYYGDNLHVLRNSLAAESVDLIYLDPPFNSKRDYNLLFKSPKGHDSDASITAFEDSWHWRQQAEREFDELMQRVIPTWRRRGRPCAPSLGRMT
jgi:site-specific DNA-methyltransferase (adenine-specific)